MSKDKMEIDENFFKKSLENFKKDKEYYEYYLYILDSLKDK